MAQYSLANQAGAAFRSALNTVLGKLHGCYAGTTDPVSASEQTAGMLWLDTNSTPAVLKIRNAANTAWISIGQVDTSFLANGTTAFSRTLLDDGSASVARATLGLTEAIVTAALASQAEAEAGTNNTRMMTPLRVAQAISALASGGEANGITGNAWTDVSGSRSYNTTYQNTSGAPLHVMVSATIGGSGEIGYVAIGPATAPLGIVEFVGSGDDVGSMYFVVPESHYYRIVGTNTVTITEWREAQ